MTATLEAPQISVAKLEQAAPGIYPWEISQGRYVGRMAVHVPPTYMKRLQQIPGALYSKADGVWTFPKAWPAVLALGTMSREMGLPMKPHPELADWVREQAGHWKTLREISGRFDPGATKGPDDLFFPHQEVDGDWLSYGGGILPTRGRLLLSETGIGKTAGVINGMLKLGMGLVDTPVLVIAPKKTLRTAWYDDLARFAPDRRAVIADGSATKRRKAIKMITDQEADILIIGWESMKIHTRFSPFPGQSLKRCEKCGGPNLSPEDAVSEAQCQAHPKELNEISWSLVVLDELHWAMNNTSAVTQAAWGVIKGAPPRIPVWGMTGTLVSKKVEQSWTSLHTVDPEAWPTKGSWVEYYAESGYNMAGFFETSGLKPQREEEFQRVFQAMSRRRLKAEVLDLPPLIMGGGMIREVGMAKEQAKAYAEMRDEMVLATKEGILVAPDPMQVALRLSGLASATGYPDPKWEAQAKDVLAWNAGHPDDQKDLPPKKMLLRLPSGKIDAVLEDLKAEEFGSGQIAMSMTSRLLLRLLERQMVDTLGIPEEEIAVIAGDITQAAADQAVYDFQAGRKRYMLYTYAAGGTGITLTAAGTLLRVERSWSPILWKQGLDRVHRIGSERHDSVNVFDYVTTGTVEEKQIDRHGQDTALLEQLVQDGERLAALDALLS
jgi:SNF2 family DNA or RNA helicase